MSQRPSKRKGGAPAGHKGWGGRPRGQQMPCGYGCGAMLTSSEAGRHVKVCPLAKRHVGREGVESSGLDSPGNAVQ